MDRQCKSLIQAACKQGESSKKRIRRKAFKNVCS